MKVYENTSAPSIKRVFVALHTSGRITKCLQISSRDGEPFKVIPTDYYTSDLKGNSPFIKPVGSVDLDRAIIKVLCDAAGVSNPEDVNV